MLKKQIAGSAPPSTPLTTTPQGRQSFKPTSFENSFFGRALNSSPHPPNYPAPLPCARSSLRRPSSSLPPFAPLQGRRA
jgi:hypothetical protein